MDVVQLSEAIKTADSKKLAYDIWIRRIQINLLEPAETPKLYVMSGLPLSGKTYLAMRIVKRSKASVVYIENDLVRKMIMEELGLPKPSYTKEEHKLVFDTSHEILWLSLSFSFHTIFDATNLNEEYRKKIYEIADAAGSEMLVIRMSIPRDVAEERSSKKFSKDKRRGHSPADIKVHDILSKEDEPIENCSRPYLVLDTSKEGVDKLIDKHDLLLS